MILQASHTHLYPGHRGNISGISRMAELQPGGDCLVEFSDGTAAAAKISKSGEVWQLSTDAYRTAAGTEIARKLWILRLEEDGKRLKFRILRRLPGK